MKVLFVALPAHLKVRSHRRRKGLGIMCSSAWRDLLRYGTHVHLLTSQLTKRRARLSAIAGALVCTLVKYSLSARSYNTPKLFDDFIFSWCYFSTQPPTLNGTRNKDRAKGGDAMRLGERRQHGVGHSVCGCMHVCRMTRKTAWSLVNTCHHSRALYKLYEYHTQYI